MYIYIYIWGQMTNIVFIGWGQKDTELLYLQMRHASNACVTFNKILIYSCISHLNLNACVECDLMRFLT